MRSLHESAKGRDYTVIPPVKSDVVRDVVSTSLVLPSPYQAPRYRRQRHAPGVVRIIMPVGAMLTRSMLPCGTNFIDINVARRYSFWVSTTKAMQHVNQPARLC